LAVLLLSTAAAMELVQRSQRTPVYEAQVSAAQRVVETYDVLHAHAQEHGLSAGREVDPNLTGVIGVSFSDITTTAGNLSTKRTSTNPDFAAYLVRIISQHASPGQGPVVIALSGSFPGLGIAAIAACEALGHEAVLLSSVGSSSFGANRPEFTWLDMEKLLYGSNMIGTRTRLASLGGGGDIGEFPVEEGRKSAQAALSRAGVPALVRDCAAAQLAGKIAVLEDAQPQLLINIGGNQAHIGTDGHLLPAGDITAPPVGPEAEFGLVGWALDNGLPAVHLLNVTDLALRHGIALDPTPFPRRGRAPLYYVEVVNMTWPAVGVLLVAGAYLAALGITQNRRSAARSR